MPTDGHVFLAPVLRGRRFDGHTVPVEVLADLAAYKELVVEVARCLYLGKNPGRTRVPKGFEDAFRLTLKQVDPGSAIPILELAPDEVGPAQHTLDGVSDAGGNRPWFFAARDVIAECVKAVSDGQQPPERFPRALLTSFNRFGRNLLADESIELAPDKQTVGVRYNPMVRRKLVLMESKTYEKPLTLVGNVTKVDTDNATLILRTSTGTITATYPVLMEGIIIEALRHHADDVRLSGMGLYDSSERLLRVTDITHVVQLDDAVSDASAEILARLEAMGDLEGGWLDGEGVAPDRPTITLASAVLAEIVDREGLSAPAVFPTPEGGIQAEWQGTPWSVEVRFLPGGQKVQVIADNLPESRDESLSLDVSDRVSSELAAWLRPRLAASRRHA